MKLIIEIPEEVLSTRHYCQYFGAWSTKLTETIENGTPYEERPQGDLISRSALKKATTRFTDSDGFNEVHCIIDNAPTAPLPDFKEGYKQAIKDGKTNFSRPQGEWNYIQAGMAVCPFCGATSHKQYKNFCPDCGADMRGKENGRNE